MMMATWRQGSDWATSKTHAYVHGRVFEFAADGGRRPHGIDKSEKKRISREGAKTRRRGGKNSGVRIQHKYAAISHQAVASPHQVNDHQRLNPNTASVSTLRCPVFVTVKLGRFRHPGARIRASER